MSEKKEKQKKMELNYSLARGYAEMASVNLALSREALSSDNDSLRLCEQILAEREEN